MRVWCCLLLGLCMMAHAKTRVEILADAAYPPLLLAGGGRRSGGSMPISSAR